MSLSRSQALALMVAVTLMWSIAGVVSRQLTQAKGFEVTFWRSAFTALSLLPLLPLLQGRGAWGRVAWRSQALWASGVCWSVMFTAFMVALTMTSVANVLITMALGPLFTALLGRVALGNRLPMRTWGAIAVAGAGIAYMHGPAVLQSMQGGASGLGGILVALCVPIAGAIQWTLTQHLQSRAQGGGATVDLVPAVFIGAVISTLAVLPLSFPFAASSADVAWLALLGMVQLAIPCSLSVLCARVLKGPEISLLALLEIIFGIALVWAIAGESPGSRALVGGALVVGALAVNEWLGMRATRATS